MPRAQNAHAYVNAGFLFKVDKKDKYRVMEKPNIVFGGISPAFVSTLFKDLLLPCDHARATSQRHKGANVQG